MKLPVTLLLVLTGSLLNCYLMGGTIRPGYNSPRALVEARTNRTFALVVPNAGIPVCGIKKNHYQDGARIKCEPDASEIVRRTLALELNATGMKETENPDMTITVNLRTFYVEQQVGLVISDLIAETDTDVTVQFSSGASYKRHFTGLEKRQIPNGFELEAEFGRAMEASLQNYMQKVVPAIVHLAKEEPL